MAQVSASYHSWIIFIFYFYIPQPTVEYDNNVNIQKKTAIYFRLTQYLNKDKEKLAVKIFFENAVFFTNA